MDASPTTQGVATKIDASGSVATMGRTKRTRKPKAWRKEFLRQLRRHGRVDRACKQACVGRQYAYQVREDPDQSRFKAAWDRAVVAARRAKVQLAEHELYVRAVKGWDEPVYQGGVLVGTKRKKSDPALFKFLECNSRRYARRSEVNVNTTSVLVSLDHQKAFLSDPAYAQAICVADALLAAPRAIQGPSSPSGEASGPHEGPPGTVEV